MRAIGLLFAAAFLEFEGGYVRTVLVRTLFDLQQMKNKIGSFAHTIKNASASVRRDILSKPFKPPGTRGVRSSRPKSDDEDDDSPTEETQPLGRRKAVCILHMYE